MSAFNFFVGQPRFLMKNLKFFAKTPKGRKTQRKRNPVSSGLPAHGQSGLAALLPKFVPETVPNATDGSSASRN
jgi:hypothetical protein